jgi:hypothetical protein
MKDWRILIVTLLIGTGIGVSAAIFLPGIADQYLPAALRLQAHVIEGQVTKKQREQNRVLLKVETDQRSVVATFTQKVPEIDLLVEPGDTITLVLHGKEPLMDNPSIERVRRSGAAEVGKERSAAGR